MEQSPSCKAFILENRYQLLLNPIGHWPHDLTPPHMSIIILFAKLFALISTLCGKIIFQTKYQYQLMRNISTVMYQ